MQRAGPMHKLLLPFVTAGYPTRQSCVDLLHACAAGGGDEIELGIPFSDPLADGPVIQSTSYKALVGGITLDAVFELAENFKAAPLNLMTYVNPVMQYGERKFFGRAASAGVKAVIVPDVPPEEADAVSAASEASGVPNIFLISPTCTDARIRMIDRLSRAWIYVVSLKGVTGSKIKADISSFVKHVRKLTNHPLYVGFGISTPEHAARIAEVADGIIVASALLKIVESGGTPKDVERFVAELRRAID